MSKNKTVRNFKASEIQFTVQYNFFKYKNKPVVSRKGFEMTEIVEAVTKKIEPDNPFNLKISWQLLSHIELKSFYFPLWSEP